MTGRPAPYQQLGPELVLDALESAGLRGDGRMLQLNSYENRVFQVHLEDGGSVVAKFYRPDRWSDAQLLEEHAFAHELAAAEVPAVAPLVLQPGVHAPVPLSLHGDPATLGEVAESAGGYRFAAARCHGGHAPEADDPETLRRLGRFIGRLHAVGARAPFVHRVSLDANRLGHAPIARLLAEGHVTAAEEPAWRTTAEAAMQRVDAAFAGLGPCRVLRLHGDCHRGNILWRDEEGPHFVDLDDACNGPAVQDLWMLLSGGERPAVTAQLTDLLEGYRNFMDFDERELALIEPLRTLRMIHHSAWIADRWGDPAFPAAFPWFGSPAYWSQQTSQLREQLEAMDEPPPSPSAQ